jgi:mersacidin/lichenicidin family type 2 lantibiotic
MNKIDVIRAWKDPVYRAGLSRDEVAGLPGHPSGFLEIDEEQLKMAAGAVITTFRTCTMLSFNNWRSCCPP